MTYAKSSIKNQRIHSVRFRFLTFAIAAFCCFAGATESAPAKTASSDDIRSKFESESTELAADSTQDEHINENSNRGGIIFAGYGYSSGNRHEINLLTITSFNTSRLGMEYVPRIDFSSSGVNLGPATALLVVGIMALPEFKSKIFSNIILGGAWLSSGSTLFNIYGDNVLGFSLIETHVFEWWFYRDEDKDFHFGELGIAEELGARINAGFIFISGGAQFEITNRRKHIGWFAKVGLLFYPSERPTLGQDRQ